MTFDLRARAFTAYVWHASAPGAVVMRVLLMPFAWLFGVIVSRRNAVFDLRRSTGATPVPALPALSVGNLSVGGTGKTPMASWFAARLAEHGASPALVLRGYGDDEWRVHGLLTPGVPVVVSPDRSSGLVTARNQQCDCAVLDDAFQHRQVHRVADVVLVSADAWSPTPRLLPAGPFREPLSSLRRASAVVITIKAASVTTVDAVRDAVKRAAPDVPVAHVRLAPGRIRLAVSLGAPANGTSLDGEEHEQSWLRGREVVLVSAIADPAAFRAQMAAAGAAVRHHAIFPDHHAFSSDDVQKLLGHTDLSSTVLCTLKDAVKLMPVWPRAAAALWYVSQTVVVERGAEVLEQAVACVLAARRATIPTAG
jgi:tetraacyldisaccharide 4'-kinase